MWQPAEWKAPGVRQPEFYLFSCLPVGRCGPNYKAELLNPHLYPKDTSALYGHCDVLDVGPPAVKSD